MFFLITGVYFYVLNIGLHIEAKHEAECTVLKEISVNLCLVARRLECLTTFCSFEAWVISFTPLCLSSAVYTNIRRSFMYDVYARENKISNTGDNGVCFPSPTKRIVSIYET